MEDTPLDIEAIVNSGPPIEWYWGFGLKQTGINRVTTSERFYEILGPNLSVWSDFCNYYSNFPDETHTAHHIKVATDALAFGSRVIKEITGYEPEEIFNKQDLLRHAFQGKHEAPFDFELYDHTPYGPY